MITVDEFTLPISKDKICGEDLKYDYIYDQIKELRREDDPRLSQGIWQTDLKKADWQEVHRICSLLLKTRTKDVQIAMWLLESMVAMDGFRGFNQGLLILQALCEKFWDELYPSIDWENHNFTSRLSPFYFFVGKIQERIVFIPLMESNDGLSGSYSLSDWMTARRNLQIKNTDGLSLRQLKKSILSTPIEFFANLQSEVKLSVENLKKLDDFISEKCGGEAPSFREVYECLGDIERIVDKSLAEKQKQMEKKPTSREVSSEEDNSTDEAIVPDSPEATKDKITLERAYDSLREISIFLEREQPQSPASTMIKIAVEIGKKNFQELMEINAKSGSIINTISELYRTFTTLPGDQ